MTTPTASPTAAGGQPTPVNELPGVQRLPSTGSGGMFGGSSLHLSPFLTAAVVLLLGVVLAGGSVLFGWRKER
jgi:hypothetical protein